MADKNKNDYMIYIYEETVENKKVLKVNTTEPEVNTEKPKEVAVLFTLELLRVRLENNKERMRLKLYEGNKVKELCKLVCNPFEIEKDLLKLREYGTGFMRKDIIDIRHIIDKNYRDIAREKVNELEAEEDRTLFRGLDLDADINNILTIIKEYVLAHEENKELEKDKYAFKFFNEKNYDVPTTACQEVLADTFYRVYSFRDIKIMLAQKGYIFQNGGTIDQTAHREKTDGTNKTQVAYKALRFFKGIIEQSEPNEQEKKKAE